jgi:hypothetical protein
LAIEANQAVWQLRGLKPAERVVLLCLADYARRDGTMAYPSVATIAARCELWARSVQVILARLRDRTRPGGPLIEATAPASRYRPTEYRLLFCQPSGVQRADTPDGVSGVQRGNTPGVARGAVRITSGVQARCTRSVSDPCTSFGRTQSSQDAGNAILDVFAAGWSRAHDGRPYVVSSRERRQAAGLSRQMTLDELRPRLAAFLRSTDHYFVREAHSFNAFASSGVNQSIVAEQSAARSDRVPSAENTRRFLDHLVAEREALR